MNREVLINIINRGGIRFIPVRRCFLCNEYVGYKFVRMCDGSMIPVFSSGCRCCGINNGIVRRDVESYQSDWFKIDKEIFMLPENKNKTFILGTRKTGCDLLILGGTNCDESYLDGVFGCLGNEKFYVCQPISLYETTRNIQERPALYTFKIATAYFREQDLVPVFENSHCKLMKL